MMAKTAHMILADLARQLREQYIDRQPDVELCRRELDEICEKFRLDHRGNRALVYSMEEILGALAGLEDVRQEYQFFMGLQMGLELAGLDIFQEFV